MRIHSQLAIYCSALPDFQHTLWLLDIYSATGVVLLLKCQLLTSYRPTLDATNKLLQQSKKQFIKSDESALSIVPSRLSSRLSLSTGLSGRRDSIGSHASMAYRRLSFENDLFTATVYKRNYRALRAQGLWKKESDLGRKGITPQQEVHRKDERLAKLKLHRTSDGRNTTDISSPRAKTTPGEGATNPIFDISVSTSCSTSVEHIDQNLQDRFGLSTLDVDGLFVRLGDTLEQRVSSSASASYLELVLACSRDWEPGLEEQLAMAPLSPPEDPGVSGFLGSYISGSLYFCPVHAAVFHGDVKVMQALLRHAETENDLERVLEKAIGGTQSDPWRPLHVAALKGNLPMVNLLLKKGASICSETGLGIQAIHMAARTGSVELLAILLDAGADVNCADRYGNQPLHYASESRDQPDVIQYLALRGASINELHRLDESAAPYLAYKKKFYGNMMALQPLIADAHTVSVEKCESAQKPFDVLGRSLTSTRSHPSDCRNDGGPDLQTFVLEYCKTAPGDRSADRKTLQLLLSHTDLRAEYANGGTFLESLFPIDRVYDKYGVRTELVGLFLEYLPLHRLWERKYLINWIGSQKDRGEKSDSSSSTTYTNVLNQSDG